MCLFLEALIQSYIFSHINKSQISTMQSLVRSPRVPDTELLFVSIPVIHAWLLVHQTRPSAFVWLQI